MTPAQLLTLKAAIAAETDPTFVALRNAGATGAMADFYNVSHATFVVWKTFVSLNAIGDKINGVEWANLTQLNVSRLQCMSDYAPQGVNPSLSDRRAFFHDIFSSAPTTQAALGNLGSLWKRFATRSDAAPATLVFEGSIGNADIVLALAS
jgi:hypothetical protein